MGLSCALGCSSNAPSSGITAVNAGSGLSGGGSSGDVELAVQFGGSGSSTEVSRADHSHAGTYLPVGGTVACSGTDKVVGVDPATGNVVCAADASGQQYSAGPGLTESSGQFSVAFAGSGTQASAARSDHNHAGSYLPLGSAVACSGTDKVTGVDPSTGNVVCGADQSSTYTAGAGLALSGSQFSVSFAGSGAALAAARADHTHAGTYLPLGGLGSCPSGQVMVGIDPSTGVMSCQPDQNTTYQAGAGLVLDSSNQTLRANFASDGGDNGNANAVARADHTHDARYLLKADLSYGRSASNPGLSCADIKAKAPFTFDGIYVIDPDGSGPNTAFEVYCDMTRDSGGWTLILRTYYQAGVAGLAGGLGSPREANSPKGEAYKLPDATIRTLIGTDNNFDYLMDEIGHNPAYSAGNNEYVIVRNYTGVFTYTAAVPESSTPTVFESYRANDGVLNWRGRLQCGTGAYGINCYNILSTSSPVGSPNPMGGAGCLTSLGTTTSSSWHNLYMGETNSDTYMYICNGAQHSSSYPVVHRVFVR